MTAARLVALGFAPVLAPLLTIHPLSAVLPDAASLQAILVASRQAIGPLPAEYRPRPLLAVGDATAEVARSHGFTRVFSADGDAEALAALAVRMLRPDDGPLLLATGLGQGQPLAARLAADGFAVHRREVYAARPMGALPDSARAMLAASCPGWVLLFSRETAFCFHRLVRHSDLVAGLRAFRVAAISQTVAETVRDLPWRSIHVAITPTENAVLALIDER